MFGSRASHARGSLSHRDASRPAEPASGPSAGHVWVARAAMLGFLSHFSHGDGDLSAECPPMFTLASIPSPESSTIEHRAAVDPLLRPHAPRRDRGRGRDHGVSVDAARRRLGPHLPRRRLGGRLRDHRRAALPRRHELGRAARRVVGAVRDLEGRPRGLGRHRARRDRRRDRREALRCQRREARGLRRAGAARRPGRSAGSGTGGTRSSSGGPTDLPWGLEISPENRPLEYVENDTFHPTFLYEALWCFAAAGVLLLIERRFRIRPGGLFALYVLVYSIGRLWIELLRVDPSHELAGVRLNAWVAGLAIVLSAAFFVWWQRGWRRDPGHGRRRRSRRWPSPRRASLEGPFVPPAV